MRFVQIVFIVAMLGMSATFADKPKKNEITCHCGVFEKKGADQMNGVPLLEKSVNFAGECDENGAKNCGQLCKSLGEAGAAHNSHELCEKVINTNKPIRPTVYSKICDVDIWTYTGLTASMDYCCIDSKHEACAGATE